MQRATPNTTSMRAFTAGGARGVVDTIDDSKLMQTHSGRFMSNEARDDIESPQNYGFTSVNMPADKDENGKITGSAETFYSFMHGYRSMPIPGPIDDRRHRLKGLEPGDTALFRTKDDDQQFHMTKDGGFWSGPNNKTLRMQLVEPGSAKPQQQGQGGQKSGGASATQQAADGGGENGGTKQKRRTSKQSNKPTGNSPVAKAGANSTKYIHITPNESTLSNTEVHSKLDDGQTYHHVANQKDWCGAQMGKKPFALVMTLAGPAKNVFGRIG